MVTITENHDIDYFDTEIQTSLPLKELKSLLEREDSLVTVESEDDFIHLFYKNSILYGGSLEEYSIIASEDAKLFDFDPKSMIYSDQFFINREIENSEGKKFLRELLGYLKKNNVSYQVTTYGMKRTDNLPTPYSIAKFNATSNEEYLSLPE